MENEFKKAFERKKRNYPSYSLRALARDIEASPSTCSRIFKGQRSPSYELAGKLCEALEIPKENRPKLFQSLVQGKVGVSGLGWISPTRASYPKVQFETADNRFFSLLNEWYYLPLLDLVETKSFQEAPEFVSKRLGIDVERALRALLELEKHKYLVRDKNGFLRKSERYLKLTTLNSKSVIRAFHSKMIKKAQTHLETKTDQESFDERLITGLTFSLSKSKISDLKTKIYQMLEEVAGESEGETPEEVYQFNVQFFPLTKDFE